MNVEGLMVVRVLVTSGKIEPWLPTAFSVQATMHLTLSRFS